MAVDERSLAPGSVSVIMPVGRVDGELAAQLDALTEQDFSNAWELVISLNTDDGGERRALETLLSERPTLKSVIVDSSSVRSASHARNIGVQAASGELLLFCDGDDIAGIGWMSAMVACLAIHEVVGGHLEEERLAIEGQEGWRPPATPGALPTFLGQPYLVTANMGIRRTAFDVVGAFDTSLIRGEDIAFSWDLLTAGIELGYAADAIMHYRHREGLMSMMRQHFLYGRGFSQILAGRDVPGHSDSGGRLAALRPNSQPVDNKGLVYVLRRGSIAAGRVFGLAEQGAERWRRTPK